MISLICLYAAIVRPNLPDYTIDRQSRTPKSDELSAEQAYKAVKGWAKKIGLRIGTAVPRLCLEEYKGSRIWIYTVDNVCSIELDPKSGGLNSYTYDGDTTEKNAKGPNSDWNPSTSEIDARLQWVSIAAGRPVAANLTAHKSYDHSYTHIVYTRYHLDREVVGAYGTYAIDVRNGEVHSIEQHFEFSIEHEEPILHLDSAIKAARVAYTQELKGTAPNELNIQHPPRLVYELADQKKPEKKTIAYLVLFGDDYVTVDATSGKCIRVSLRTR